MDAAKALNQVRTNINNAISYLTSYLFILRAL
jgi:hypothetical protein